MRKKEIEELIGEENWDRFSKWMKGQTCGMYEDREINYYSHDVYAFIHKLNNGYDIVYPEKLD